MWKEAPDYKDIVKQPMDFATLSKRVEAVSDTGGEQAALELLSAHANSSHRPPPCSFLATVRFPTLLLSRSRCRPKHPTSHSPAPLHSLGSHPRHGRDGSRSRADL